MNTPKLLNFFVLLWLASNGACTTDRLNLPEPARSIEGVYEANDNTAPFPIQGQTIRLNVSRVTPDSVKVIVRAIVNGQLGDSLVYNRALVSQGFGGTIPGEMCVGYQVFLNPPQGHDELKMTCEETSVFRYLYKPAGSQSRVTVRFKKI